MQSLWDFWIVIHCAHEFSLQWGDLIFLYVASAFTGSPRPAAFCGMMPAMPAGSDSESRQTTTRTTTVKGNDSLTVLGSVTLMAGAVLQLSDGDYSIGAANKFGLRAQQLQQDIESDAALTVGGTLTEKITGIRKSVAAAQVINGQTVNIGDGEINILDCLTDTLDVLQELAELTAQHAHSNTGTPTNSGAISANAQRPGQLTAKYKKLIA